MKDGAKPPPSPDSLPGDWRRKSQIFSSALWSHPPDSEGLRPSWPHVVRSAKITDFLDSPWSSLETG